MAKSVKKQIAEIHDVLEAHEENFSDLSSVVRDMTRTYKPYSGAISLSIDIGDAIKRFFMVTDFVVIEPFIIFFHLTAEDGRALTPESFPAKAPRKTIQQHMTEVYKSGRWVVVKEQALLGSFSTISSIGGFDYQKPIKKGDYPYRFNENEEAVKPLKK